MGGLFSLLFGSSSSTSAPTSAPIQVTVAPDGSLQVGTVTDVPVVTPTPSAAPFATITATSSPTPWAPTAPQWKSIRSGAGDNLCLNTQLQVVQCLANDAGQTWAYDATTGLVVNKSTGNCMTVGDINNSVPITLNTCNPSNTKQQWLQPKNGSLVLKGNSNLSLDIPGGNVTSPVSTWFVNNGGAQSWTFQ